MPGVCVCVKSLSLVYAICHDAGRTLDPSMIGVPHTARMALREREKGFCHSVGFRAVDARDVSARWVSRIGRQFEPFRADFDVVQTDAIDTRKVVCDVLLQGTDSIHGAIANRLLFPNSRDAMPDELLDVNLWF